MFSTITTLSLFLISLLSLYFIFEIINKKNTITKNGCKTPPGPRPLPIIGNLHQLRTSPHRTLHQLAQKYGPIMFMWLGQVPTIIVSSPHAAELFLKTHDTNFANRVQSQASDYISYGSKGVLFSEYGSYWRSMRKLCTLHLLSSSKVESFAPLRKEGIEKLVIWLKKASEIKQVVNISDKVYELIEGMAYKMVFGSNCVYDDDDDMEGDLRGLIKQVMTLAGTFNLADFVPFLGALDLQGISKRLKKVQKKLDQVLEKIILKHEQEASSKQAHEVDFVDVLISLMNKPINLQDKHVYTIDRTNIKAILVDMFIGAFDTSAIIIQWTLSELVRNPRVMNLLQTELQNVIGTNQMVEEKYLEKLPYLNMVLKESFRLHPVAQILIHKSIKDIIIEGYYIPKKSMVVINPWSLGHDPNVWSENVEEFYPERFINSKIDLNGQDFELIPFGSGRRGCPGLTLGLTTVRFAVAQLVHCFNWELPIGVKPSDVDMIESSGLTLPKAKSLFVRPILRFHKGL